MYRNAFRVAELVLGVTVVSVSASAQQTKNVTLHVSPRWEDCAFQLDPSLTQGAWRQFTREAGLVSYFRPLTDARPMGRGTFELSLLQWQTGIDDTESAWNDTFVHPDSMHYLFDGSGLTFPGFMLRVGVTKRIDVGAYAAKNPLANYGVYAGQMQLSIVDDTVKNWAAATRVSVASLSGPDDLGLTVVGVDALASKTYVLASWASLSPYGGVSSYVSRAHETSSLVTLADETTVGAQAMVGIAARVSVMRLAVEYNAAHVASRSIKLGVRF
ncbi:MAG: hypothetical protein MNPFHGCM_03235 [Gemmatimonadaceae bacterium]|nr:hypothetical protein [Gemmatimonadaceae bacterium]